VHRGCAPSLASSEFKLPGRYYGAEDQECSIPRGFRNAWLTLVSGTVAVVAVKDLGCCMLES
jgi:hypothetical protein